MRCCQQGGTSGLQIVHGTDVMIKSAVVEIQGQAVGCFPLQTNQLKHAFLKMSLPILESSKGGCLQGIIGLMQQHVFYS